MNSSIYKDADETAKKLGLTVTVNYDMQNNAYILETLKNEVKELLSIERRRQLKEKTV